MVTKLIKRNLETHKGVLNWTYKLRSKLKSGVPITALSDSIIERELQLGPEAHYSSFKALHLLADEINEEQTYRIVEKDGQFFIRRSTKELPMTFQSVLKVLELEVRKCIDTLTLESAYADLRRDIEELGVQDTQL